jgi:diketogulonate reductase-like aldo/keto reductase
LLPLAATFLPAFLLSSFIPLPKSVTPSRIISNTHLYDFSLSPAQMEALDELDKGLEGSVSWGGAVMQWKEKA